MTQDAPQPIFLKDYRVSDFLVDQVALHVDIFAEYTRVSAVLKLRRNPAGQATVPLFLDGVDLQLQSIELAGERLAEDQYQLSETGLEIAEVPDEFELKTVVHIQPTKNTKLSGLYVSRGNYCTQCESHGFRRITYFLDRPDVLSLFTVTISADQHHYPQLLSNGHLVDAGEDEGNRHWAKWHDPSLKPCYLFALVAGDFECVEDQFVTQDNRTVALKLYVELGRSDQCEHAMQSLKRAMQWDEDTYGRIYDLDLYMIVAVSDFNYGAMENKGLNIFNSQYILAQPETATDLDYLRIEAVVAHEYFHNWSGNRVTCRDWFQLSLKEGFTVLRDQQFTADMTQPVIKRIDDVTVLRNVQFPEDAGPMAHPIRPASYIEMNNFYTTTVYNKGAEVIRMLHTLLGAAAFRKGADLYFERHDGQAVTTDDFVAAMADASGYDLKQFLRWYAQAGTPVLTIEERFDAQRAEYHLMVKQHCPATPGQARKLPFYLPLAVGLLDEQGEELSTQLSTEAEPTPAGQRVLVVKKAQEHFIFAGVKQRPIPSLLRGFSAPVKLVFEQPMADQLHLLRHDADGFNRWDVGQRLFVSQAQHLVRLHEQGERLVLPEELLTAFAEVLTDDTLDPALRAAILTVPSEHYLIELSQVANVPAIHQVREFIKTQLGKHMRPMLLDLYAQLATSVPYAYESVQMNRRRLRNLCLAYLVQLHDQEALTLCKAQYEAGQNMTDIMAALNVITHVKCVERSEMLSDFGRRFRDDDLVMDKWFGVQAVSSLPDTLNQVKRLMQNDLFDMKNPNRVRALIGQFTANNPVRFHDADGSGYQFLVNQLLVIDGINSQVAGRLVTPLTRLDKFDSKRQALMKTQLARLLAHENLSKDLYEVVSKTLAQTCQASLG